MTPTQDKTYTPEQAHLLGIEDGYNHFPEECFLHYVQYNWRIDETLRQALGRWLNARTVDRAAVMADLGYDEDADYLTTMTDVGEALYTDLVARIAQWTVEYDNGDLEDFMDRRTAFAHASGEDRGVYYLYDYDTDNCHSCWTGEDIERIKLADRYDAGGRPIPAARTAIAQREYDDARKLLDAVRGVPNAVDGETRLYSVPGISWVEGEIDGLDFMAVVE